MTLIYVVLATVEGDSADNYDNYDTDNGLFEMSAPIEDDEQHVTADIEDVVMQDVGIEVDNQENIINMQNQLDNVVEEESLTPKSKLTKNLLNFRKTIDSPIEVEINTTDGNLTSSQRKSLEFYDILSANNVPKNAKEQIIKWVNDYIGENCSGT